MPSGEQKAARAVPIPVAGGLTRAPGREGRAEPDQRGPLQAAACAEMHEWPLALARAAIRCHHDRRPAPMAGVRGARARPSRSPSVGHATQRPGSYPRMLRWAAMMAQPIDARIPDEARSGPPKLTAAGRYGLLVPRMGPSCATARRPRGYGSPVPAARASVAAQAPSRNSTRTASASPRSARCRSRATW